MALSRIAPLLGPQAGLPPENRCDLDHSPHSARVRGVIWITTDICKPRYTPFHDKRRSPYLAARRKSEAHMRKNVSFAIAAAMLGLAMIFWAGSSVVSAEIVRSKVGLSSQVVIPSSYLPIQAIKPIW